MGNALIIAILVILVFFAVRSIIKNRKKGCHCGGCPCSGSCNKTECNKDCGSTKDCLEL